MSVLKSAFVLMNKGRKALDRPKTKQSIMEKEWDEKYLKPFDSLHSEAWKYLSARFGKKLRHDELKEIAYLASKYNNLPFPREYYRKKKGLILWVDTYYDIVVKWLDNNLKAFDKNGNEIFGAVY